MANQLGKEALKDIENIQIEIMKKHIEEFKYNNFSIDWVSPAFKKPRLKKPKIKYVDRGVI